MSSTSVLTKNHLQQINDRAITNFKTQKFKFPNNDLVNNRIHDDYDIIENSNIKLINNKKCINKICRIECILIIIILMIFGIFLHFFYGGIINLFDNFNNNNNQTNFSTNFIKLNLNYSTNQRLIVNNSLMNDNNLNHNNININNSIINNNNHDLTINYKKKSLIAIVESDIVKTMTIIPTIRTIITTTTTPSQQSPTPSSKSTLQFSQLPLSMKNSLHSNDDAYLFPSDENINFDEGKSKLNDDHHPHKNQHQHKHQHQLFAISHNYSISEDNNDDDNVKLLEIIKNGLGLNTIPDITKANISQTEYVTKYMEYLERVRVRQQREIAENKNHEFIDEHFNSPLQFTSVNYNFSESYEFRMKRSIQKNSSQIINSTMTTASQKKLQNPANLMYIRFPLNLNEFMQSAATVEEANIRLLLATNPSMSPHRNSNKHRNRNNRNNRNNKKKFNNDENDEHEKKEQNHFEHKNSQKRHVLNMKVFQLIEPKGRVWLDGKKIEINLDDSINDETITQWLQFDVTTAVEGWISGKYANMGLEIQCDNCYRLGARIIDDLAKFDDDDKRFDDGLGPVLNIIGRGGSHTEKRIKQHQHQQKGGRKPRKTDCYKENQRCCRHNMEVNLKEIKGFEFIIEPKKFDAGYCKGRCPPRYNPAHHHAVLQSLIWKKDRNRAPKPCCAPSKLAELEVLHYDEKDPSKLKTTTWAGMRVLECACS